uniref:RICIN domain-containing protein n=1 Tax=Paractinoplanes polyasparticus TaxID=2856853 RepID=UPI0021083AD7|nr:RICIN domain-containing protein [Actinoplanes polyasparticus]
MPSGGNSSAGSPSNRVDVPSGREQPAAVVRPPRPRRRVVLWSVIAAVIVLSAGGVGLLQRAGENPIGQEAAVVSTGSEPKSPLIIGSRPSPVSTAAGPARSRPATTPRTSPQRPRDSSPASRAPSAAPSRPDEPTPTPDPRAGEIRSDSGGCADNNSSVAADGNRLQVVPCNDSAAQLWTVRRDGRLEVQGLCMTVRGGGTAAGTRVVLFTCGAAAAQVWRPKPDGTLRSAASGRCLGVLAESDTALVLQNCVGRVSQRWVLP